MKRVYSGMVTAKPAKAPTSASQRAAAASPSRCTASTSDPGDDRHPNSETQVRQHQMTRSVSHQNRNTTMPRTMAKAY